MSDIVTETGKESGWDDSSLSLNFNRDIHFIAIESLYGDKTTTRSGVPLINHIKEGIYILDSIGADVTTKQAYSLHPMFQGDPELSSLSPHQIQEFDPWALVLVMEYRNIANAYLSTRTIISIDEISLSPLPQVQEMLIADKIQNRKDFDAFHKGSHPRSSELDRYFQNWFKRLNISDEFYSKMVNELNILSAS